MPAKAGIQYIYKPMDSRFRGNDRAQKLTPIGIMSIFLESTENIKINRKLKRKEWMLQLCDELAEFYPREIAKIKERSVFFAQTKAFWQKWPD
ncbi:MAG: hypothetical protein DRP62_04390 [Planctomycetota bacterium]|nr:MAG: hypothetical protein DRP62_04390 [Planctomycetota bacterium]